ncbi:MAG: succinate dehydrogenase/fumarate reductase iron-sulfur subunit, partial [Verrucomicrobiales bacterium]
MATEKLNLTLKVWRQAKADAEGRIETYDAKDIPTTASFLE